MIFSLIAVALLLVLAACAGAHARWRDRPQTCWVSVIGNDATARRGDHSRPFASIRAAVDASKPGDDIQVGPGEYVIDKPIEVRDRRHLSIRGVSTWSSWWP